MVSSIEAAKVPPHQSSKPGCWFEDGDILLQAEDTLFRVHIDSLRKASAVFDDMFSLPQPEVSQKLGDPSEPTDFGGACPLVEMQETAKDMELLLSAIHDSRCVVHADLSGRCYSRSVRVSSFLSKSCGALEYAALLRLTHKFQAESLRKLTVANLLLEFPDTLKAYKHVMADHTESSPPGECCSSHLQATFASWSARAIVLEAARSTDANILLPTMLLMACLEPMEDILDTPESVLSRETLKAIIIGRDRVSHLARLCTFKFLSAARYNHGCKGRCEEYRRRLLHDIELHTNTFDPFHVLDLKKLTTWNLCPDCLSDLKKGYRRGLALAWYNIPHMFRLGTWEALTQEAGLPVSESPVVESP